MWSASDVIVQAEEYLRIYFAGLSGLLLYNSGSGILRAVGDTKRPLYFLVVSAVVNTVLDIVFVAVFRMGIAGVAIATVIAQLASAVLTLMVLTRTAGEYHVTLRELRVDKEMLGKICALGLPAALQLAVTSFSNVFVQSYINRFGSGPPTIKLTRLRCCRSRRFPWRQRRLSDRILEQVIRCGPGRERARRSG